MKTFAVVFFGVFFFLANSAEVPDEVKSVECSSTPVSSDVDECLYIRYKNGLEEYAGLLQQGGSDQVLRGLLYTKNGSQIEDSQVSVTRHDDDEDLKTEDAYVMIEDPTDGELYTLECNLATGQTKQHEITFGEDVQVDQPMLPPANETSHEVPLLDDRYGKTPPIQGFRMRVQVVIDYAFRRKFGYRAQQTIDKIFAHGNTYFKHSQSLGTKFELEQVKPLKTIGSYLTASSGNLERFKRMVQYGGGSYPEANAYALFSYEYNRGGTLGIAWMGTTCSSKHMRTSINEYTNDEMTSAITFVHELGHNLGMSHDFNKRPSWPRYSRRSRQRCTGIGGYMDYKKNPHRWSPCSKEDFASYYARQRNFCLPLLSTYSPPTSRPNTPRPNPPGPNPTSGPSTSGSSNDVGITPYGPCICKHIKKWCTYPDVKRVCSTTCG